MLRIALMTLLLLGFGTACTQDRDDESLAFIQGTYSANIENLFDALAPEFEWIEMANGPYEGTYNTLAELQENIFAHIGADWENFRPEPDGFVAQDDTVAVTGTYRGTFRQTGKELAARFTHVWQISDGMIVGFEQFTDTLAYEQAMTP